jgi:hypothetical protein
VHEPPLPLPLFRIFEALDRILSHPFPLAPSLLLGEGPLTDRHI